MNRPVLRAAAVVLLLSPLLSACSSTVPPAELILTNGVVQAVESTAEALAIGEGGTILAVGSSREIERYRGAQTRVVDLAGSSVFPGFHDMHVHPMGAGQRQKQCMFPQGSNLETIQARIASCVAEKQPGEWIRGGQWDAVPLGGTPNAGMLDAVSPDNPVILTATSGHSSWANSLALRLSGVTRNTPDPEGGIIVRDSRGEPTGVFHERASRLIRVEGESSSFEEQKEALRWALQQLLSFGITSLVDAGVSQDSAKAYAELADEGILKQRVQLCFRGASPSPEELKLQLESYRRDRISPDCIKIMLDGVPTDSHTAAMLEPYDGTSGQDSEARRTGLLMVPPEELKEQLIAFDRLGLAVKMHAAGDAAVRAGLDAIEAARQANGASGLPHNVGHVTFISTEDIPRGLTLGATYEVSPYLWSPTPINDAITAAAGPERIERVWPVRSLIESGALVVPGSDWSVIPSPNPWPAIETLVTREVPGGGASFGKANRITLQQAIDMFTVNSARQAGREGITGRIAAGALADLVVVDRNPFEIPVTELHKIVVEKTIIAGEIVYERGS